MSDGCRAGIEAPGNDALSLYYHIFVGQELIRVADAGKCVIVDHGAAALLKDGAFSPLHVLIRGSELVRARQVELEAQLCPSSALKAVRQADERQAGFLMYAYSFNYLEAQHYDLVLNTDHASNQAAAELILAAARSQIAEVNVLD
jgi:cytidylate kinase